MGRHPVRISGQKQKAREAGQQDESQQGTRFGSTISRKVFMSIPDFALLDNFEFIFELF